MAGALVVAELVSASSRPASDTGFPCTGCGACCRVAGLNGHPSLDGKVCIFLDEGSNLCTIYETRPDVCRFGFKKRADQTLRDHAVEIAEGCNFLQALMGMDESYRVKV